MTSAKRRIVILGGGFGGVFAAKRLEKIFAKSKDVEIVLISDQNYLLLLRCYLRSRPAPLKRNTLSVPFALSSGEQRS